MCRCRSDAPAPARGARFKPNPHPHPRPPTPRPATQARPKPTSAPTPSLHMGLVLQCVLSISSLSLSPSLRPLLSSYLVISLFRCPFRCRRGSTLCPLSRDVASCAPLPRTIKIELRAEWHTVGRPRASVCVLLPFHCEFVSVLSSRARLLGKIRKIKIRKFMPCLV